MSNQDLKALVKACQQKDYRAQKELYDLFVDRLYFVIRRYITNNDKIKSILQDTFLKVFNHISSYDENKGQLYTWIYTIAVRLCINEIKKAKSIFNVDELKDYIIPVDPDIESELYLEDLNEIIEQVKSPYRIVFNLYEVEGYSHQEIAKLLGISESSSRTYLVRAKTQLKSKLKLLNR